MQSRLGSIWCNISKTGKARGDWNWRAATLGTCPNAWHTLRQFRVAPCTLGDDNQCQEKKTAAEWLPTRWVKLTLYMVPSREAQAHLELRATATSITSRTGCVWSFIDYSETDPNASGQQGHMLFTPVSYSMSPIEVQLTTCVRFSYFTQEGSKVRVHQH